MLIHIRHATHYRYDRDVELTQQLVRLTPRGHAGQRIIRWRVAAEGDRALAASDDGYGNIIHLLTLNRTHSESTVVAEGEVETVETHGVVAGTLERLAPLYFL